MISNTPKKHDIYDMMPKPYYGPSLRYQVSSSILSGLKALLVVAFFAGIVALAVMYL